MTRVACDLQASDGGFQGAMRTYYLTPKMSKIMMMTPTTNAQLGI